MTQDELARLADAWEALRRLAAAVGDYKWLLNGRDKAGRCTLGCEATEGQYHADDCPAGILSAAYLAAVDRLVASPAPDPGADVERDAAGEPVRFWWCPGWQTLNATRYHGAASPDVKGCGEVSYYRVSPSAEPPETAE